MANVGQGADSEMPAIYESTPPDWLPKTSSSADLGFINFFPPRPSQEEDILTEANVKHGFTLKTAIPAETYTSKTRQIKELKDGSLIHELEDFMNQVFQRRTENLYQIPASTFRIPPRVTLNDAKRNAWFADLANPAVPLHKLGKNIPHGVRGHDLLDHLHTNNVAIPRAVWFIRVFGSNETAGLRNKPNYNPMQYSIDWANVVTSYLKKQLSEIALPSAPRPGINIRQTFRGVLADPDSRERWVSKFIYTLDLLKVFYSEHMVDHTTFLSWLVQILGSCNLAQAGFITRLADDYLGGMSSCRALLKPFIDACLAKLQEISNSSSKETLEQLQAWLIHLIRRAFFAGPTSFVSPRMWKAHSETIIYILTGPDLVTPNTDGRQSMQSIRLLMRETLYDVERRNEAMLFRTGAQPTKGCLRSMVSDVAYGDHRPYAAVTLLRQWRDKTEERASRRDFASPNEVIQDELFDWLDTNEKASDERNFPLVSLLFGELIQNGLFSYDQYIQRIIARGETGLSFNEEPGSRHRMSLRVIPLYKSNPALINQRRMALYGVRARTIPEDKVEADMKNELRELLPEVFKGEPSHEMPKSSLPRDSVLRMSARYEQIRVVKHWFMPSVHKFLTKVFSTSPEDFTLVLRVYCLVIECLSVMKCYRAGLKLTLDVLKITTSTDLLMATVDILKCGLNIWVCMDTMNDISQALLVTHKSWKSRGVHIRCLVNLLLEVDDGKFLDAVSRKHVIEDALHFAQALSPIDDNSNQVPSVLPEVLLLAQNYDPDAPSSLANALWYKYRASPNWTYTVWDNVSTSLRQVPSIITDASERHECALRYAKFLLHVDLHSADGINDQVLQWLVGTGLNEVKPLRSDAWDVLNIVFLYLAVHEAIRIATLLQGLVYPAWQIGSSIESVAQFEDDRIFLRATNTLCKLLLVEHLTVSEDGLPPSDLLEMQKLKTRRRDVYRDANFRLLAENIPALVFIENNEHLDIDFRVEVAELRRSICCKSEFRLGAARNISSVVGAFANPLDPKGMQESMHEPLISALRLIFDDEEGDDQAQATAFLSPWKLSGSAAVTSFVLQQIGQRLNRASTKTQAKNELSKLAGRLMSTAITAQEADFVSEMAKGASVDVAGEFVNKGLLRIADILDEVDDTQPESLASLPVKAGHFLNLLSTIMQPYRHLPSPLPSLDGTVQDKFIISLLRKFSALEEALRSQTQRIKEKDNVQVPLRDPVLFLARLLQFDLGFPGAWTQVMKDVGDQVIEVVLRLALLHGGGLMTDPVAFPLILDTAFYVFDEFPSDTRQTTDLFQHCPIVDDSYFPFNMPREFRNMISTLYMHVPHNPLTADLVYATRDADGTLHQGAPVQMRPWEWIESLGDPPPTDAKEAVREAEEREKPGNKYLVRNNTSIPLEMFGARIAGEGIRHLGAGMQEVALDDGERLRSLFEDDLSAESMYERDWRESRVVIAESSSTSAAHGEGSYINAQAKEQSHRRGTPGSHRGSPALSVHTSVGSRSLKGGPPSTTSTRQTQSPVVTDRGEPMDVDSLPSANVNTKGKRKASVAELAAEDDDIVIVGESSTKKGKGASGKSVSTKASEKTIAGKTTRKRR
ncbi:hypothetical protein EW145_g5157 [Phellinidium pouzarii]|uniref:Mediator of RNA polymerase II transcription subunit 12 n=1 Tax=Phellinidium pouzarii TaxID=167371 RepID=A0A4S4L160_9AGAM|nr:hypothetical protein EW145_g5157 [Phellinidium pouzarii]